MSVNTKLTTQRKQRTIAAPASFSGIGVHTGALVTIRFNPAPENTGIVFRRSDLPGTPLIPANIEHVRDTQRSTTIGIGDICIHTVEHVLAAVKAYSLDNLCIDVSGVEPPVGNGSSDVFVDMIESVGTVDQKQTTPIIKIKHPVYWSEGEIHLVALPYDGYRISYTLNYPESSVLRSQFFSILVDEENFKKEIAPCRTFSRYEEISILMDRGLIKGGSLANAVIIKDNVIFSKEGLFFPDEMVRHKILDMIGDLSLVGKDFHAHVIAIRAGHATNFAFAKQLNKYIMSEKL